MVRIWFLPISNLSNDYFQVELNYNDFSKLLFRLMCVKYKSNKCVGTS